MLNLNKIVASDVSYLSNDKTIETVQVFNSDYSTLLDIKYIFNSEGLYFYVFDTIVELIKYFGPGISEHKMFDNEKEMDKYLQELKF